MRGYLLSISFVFLRITVTMMMIDNQQIIDLDTDDEPPQDEVQRVKDEAIEELSGCL